jgi:hypothetical protein
MQHTDWAPILPLLSKQMKRVSQFAAAILILLLGVQPALLGAACAMNGATRAACPLCMSAIGADCPMAQGMAACCNRIDLGAVVLPAIPAKPRPARASARILVAAELHSSAVAPSRGLPPVIDSSPPPRYLLSRVFRI